MADQHQFLPLTRYFFYQTSHGNPAKSVLSGFYKESIDARNEALEGIISVSERLDQYFHKEFMPRYKHEQEMLNDPNADPDNIQKLIDYLEAFIKIILLLE